MPNARQPGRIREYKRSKLAFCRPRDAVLREESRSLSRVGRGAGCRPARSLLPLRIPEPRKSPCARGGGVGGRPSRFPSSAACREKQDDRQRHVWPGHTGKRSAVSRADPPKRRFACRLPPGWSPKTPGWPRKRRNLLSRLTAEGKRLVRADDLENQLGAGDGLFRGAGGESSGERVIGQAKR